MTPNKNSDRKVECTSKETLNKQGRNIVKTAYYLIDSFFTAKILNVPFFGDKVLFCNKISPFDN